MSNEFISKLSALVNAAMQFGADPTGPNSKNLGERVNGLTVELERYVERLEAVAKAAKEYIHDCNALWRGELTIHEYAPGEDPKWRLRKVVDQLNQILSS